MKTVFMLCKTKAEMPFHSCLFPICIPFHFFARSDKELHFHLLEFAHSENKLAGHYLIAKCFARLRNTKRNFHSPRFLHIGEIYKYTLSGFGAQINSISLFTNRPNLRTEHKIELT